MYPSPFTITTEATAALLTVGDSAVVYLHTYLIEWCDKWMYKISNRAYDQYVNKGEIPDRRMDIASRAIRKSEQLQDLVLHFTLIICG